MKAEAEGLQKAAGHICDAAYLLLTLWQAVYDHVSHRAAPG